MSSMDKKLIDKMMKGKLCPYCKSESKLVDSSIIYGKSYGPIHYCQPCDAYVGCHKGTNKALGRLANKELRHWKKEAHLYFDKLWKDCGENRSEVYGHLGDHLQLDPEHTHIGMFGIDTCKKVINWSKQKLNDLRRLDLDFGVEVDRPHYDIDHVSYSVRVDDNGRTGKGYQVITQSGLEGRTYHEDGLVNGKQPVYLANGKRMLCTPGKLKLKGFVD